MVRIPVLRSVTEANALLADALRERFGRQDVLVLNIIASPGAGKTTLLERTIEKLHGELRLSVIEGDPTTSLDSERIFATGVPVVQINTDGGCHLEARMIQEALEQLEVENADVIIIENVGNLVCPSAFELGEDGKIAVLSVAEGDDKPAKYPALFSKSKVLLINKIDLLDSGASVDFDVDKVKTDARKLNEQIEYFINNIIRSAIVPVSFVDDNNGTNFMFECLTQYKPCLRHWPLERIDQKQDTIGHLENALNFTAKVGVARRIDNIDFIFVAQCVGIVDCAIFA